MLLCPRGEDKVWREAYEASTTPCDTCKKCEFLHACGGGHLARRWSAERRFDNPSVDRESWKRILGHVWDRIAPTLTVAGEPVGRCLRRGTKLTLVIPGSVLCTAPE